MQGAAAMDEWVDRLQRHLGWIIGLGGLIAWLALLYFMFGDVL